MERQALVDSIAYCGLVCGLCHLKEECDFCKNTASLCARSEVCYQRNCCVKRDLQGCWECAGFPCGKDMHGPSHDLRIKAFIAFIKVEGAEALVDCLLKNHRRRAITFTHIPLWVSRLTFLAAAEFAPNYSEPRFAQYTPLIRED